MSRALGLHGQPAGGGAWCVSPRKIVQFMDANLRSPHRQLIELRMEHADLNSLIDRIGGQPQPDDLALRRLKKRRLLLRDQIRVLEAALEPPEPA